MAQALPKPTISYTYQNVVEPLKALFKVSIVVSENL